MDEEKNTILEEMDDATEETIHELENNKGDD